MTTEQLLKLMVGTLRDVREAARKFPPRDRLEIEAILERFDLRVVHVTFDDRDREMNALRAENKTLRNRLDDVRHENRRLRAGTLTGDLGFMRRKDRNRLKRRLKM